MGTIRSHHTSKHRHKGTSNANPDVVFDVIAMPAQPVPSAPQVPSIYGHQLNDDGKEWLVDRSAPEPFEVDQTTAARGESVSSVGVLDGLRLSVDAAAAEQADHTEPAAVIVAGSQMVYLATNELVSVVEIHLDDPNEVYYTVTMADGREKQTTHSKLQQPTKDQLKATVPVTQRSTRQSDTNSTWGAWREDFTQARIGSASTLPSMSAQTSYSRKHNQQSDLTERLVPLDETAAPGNTYLGYCGKCCHSCMIS